MLLGSGRCIYLTNKYVYVCVGIEMSDESSSIVGRSSSCILDQLKRKKFCIGHMIGSHLEHHNEAGNMASG